MEGHKREARHDQRSSAFVPSPSVNFKVMDTTVPIVPFLAASWLNVIMYSVEIMLCWRYFNRPSRPLIHKIGVSAMLLADTICTLAINVSLCLTVNGAVTRNIHAFTIPVAIQIVTTYSTAVITQLFFTNLFRALVKSLIICGILVILIAVHFGFSFSAAILLVKTIANRQDISFRYTAVGAINCAGTDVIIALCLVTKFWLLMRNTIPGQSARSVVRRIIVLVVASGGVCATTTLTMMILVLKGNPAFNVLFVLQGRVYALSILGNFLVGTPGSSLEATGQTHGYRSSVSHSIVFRIPGTSVAPITDVPEAARAGAAVDVQVALDDFHYGSTRKSTLAGD
ncbi:hypothetical protein R3P38DRAFT_2609548 [Favolaschia claudopus]|uniref:Integral membrane protein n=1 Tax=Favolaschia claudopus TaxID=2862362 RepID=A0AAW0D1C0_9AGAR